MRYDEPILNATQESDPRVRWRAWRMWLAEGRPEGRELDYLRRARELQAIDDNPAATRLPDAVLQQYRRYKTSPRAEPAVSGGAEISASVGRVTSSDS